MSPIMFRPDVNLSMPMLNLSITLSRSIMQRQGLNMMNQQSHRRYYRRVIIEVVLYNFTLIRFS
jgi:hypothetical protein